MVTAQAAATGPFPSGVPSRALNLASRQPLAIAVLTYVIIRVVCLTAIFFWSDRDTGMLTILGRHFDSVHYVSIATHGYSTMNLAFFPLFPLLIRAGLILPVSATVAALAIAWVGSLAAAAGIFKVGTLVGGGRTGLMLVALWAVLPHALVESMAYTEGLFTAFASWSLYFALREQWVGAGALAFFACLTRPTGVALIAALAVGATVAVVRHRQWRAFIAPLMGLTAWAGYLTWVAIRVGRSDGWFWVQRHFWHSDFDEGRANFHEVGAILTAQRINLVLYVVTAVVACALLFFALSISSGQPLVLLVYSGCILLLALGSNTGPNKARLLIPAFALLLPPAIALAKVRTREAIAVLATGAAVSAWFGGYLALIWPWSP